MKHQSAFRFHQKEHKKEEESVLAFQEGTDPKSRKGTALKNKMCLKTSFIKKEKSQKAAKRSLWRTKSNAETSLHVMKLFMWKHWTLNSSFIAKLSFPYDRAPKRSENVLNNVLYFKQVKEKRPDNISMDRYITSHWQDSTFSFDPRRHAYLWFYPHLFAAFKHLKFSSWPF